MKKQRIDVDADGDALLVRVELSDKDKEDLQKGKTIKLFWDDPEDEFDGSIGVVKLTIS